MIVDAHTHIFPATFIAERDALMRDEPVFADLYSSPQAAMAGVDHLLRAMDEAEVEHAVIAGFAWRDTGRCRQHNDALLAAAGRMPARLSAFCCVPFASVDEAVWEIDRCAAAGARGLGELRPESLGVDLAGGEMAEALAERAAAHGLPVLFHASEPVGHAYPGKAGQSLGPLWAFIEAHPMVTPILAHLGGGLPLYAHMPEVRAAFERMYVDTAAVPWLYGAGVYRTVIDLIGAERVLFASDYPLRHPRRDLAILNDCGLSPGERRAVLGGNAARLLLLPGGQR